MIFNHTMDCHMHSEYSDGRHGIDQVAEAAIEKGLAAIAITDHMPLPFATRYAMAEDRLAEYRAALFGAKEKYKERLTIFAGLEIEYIPRCRQWIKKIADMGWDLLLVSVHGIVTEEGHFMVNGREDEFKQTLEQVFENDIQVLCARYFHLIREAVSTGWFDAAAHLDVIKKHNQDGCFFNETDPWYRQLVLETLDAMAGAGVKMEINTSGITHPAKDAYPSGWVISEARRRGIGLMLGSDAHHPRFQGQYFDRFKPVIS